MRLLACWSQEIYGLNRILLVSVLVARPAQDLGSVWWRTSRCARTRRDHRTFRCSSVTRLALQSLTWTDSLPEQPISVSVPTRRKITLRGVSNNLSIR
jgi:hypothetical protein